MILRKIKTHSWSAVLCILMWLNLFYMHYEVYIIKNGYENTDGFSPLFFMCYDVLGFLFVFEIITFGKRKISFSLAYVSILLFTLANIIYSRFMGQYLQLYAFGETNNFYGTWWVQYLPVALEWKDLYLVINALVAFLLWRKLPANKSWVAPVHVLCAFFVISVFYVVVATRSERVSLRSLNELINWKWHPLQFSRNITSSVVHPDLTIFTYGIIEGQLIFNIITNHIDADINENDRHEIDEFIRKRMLTAPELNDSCSMHNTPDIVMIVLESGLSSAVECCLDGQYVMPCIRGLIDSQNSYYNPNMRSNRGAGESSDAQVSYFTGLIPLKNEFSVLRILQDSVIALPSLLKQSGYETTITIPNDETFWHQKELSSKYGFDKIIALGNESNNFWCHDEDIFRNSLVMQKTMNHPFFHCILTLTMHAPYVSDIVLNEDFIPQYPDSYSPEYRQYLKRCNYTDRQIGRYISHLRQLGRLDSTVIIIVADHEPPIDRIMMPKKDLLDNKLPLIIANNFINVSNFSHKECNQVDFFPTMLDMLGVNSEWRGIGRSLLRNYKTYDLTEKESIISSNILRGNYFGK